MKRLIIRLLRRDEGQDLIEYAMLATLISLAGIAGITALQAAIATVFSAIAMQLH